MIDLDEVNMDQNSEKVELYIISKAFSRVKMKSLRLKPNLYFWETYFGKNTQRWINLLSTKHR